MISLHRFLVRNIDFQPNKVYIIRKTLKRAFWWYNFYFPFFLLILFSAIWKNVKWFYIWSSIYKTTIIQVLLSTPFYSAQIHEKSDTSVFPLVFYFLSNFNKRVNNHFFIFFLNQEVIFFEQNNFIQKWRIGL